MDKAEPELLDPTKHFCESVRKDCRKRGQKMAEEMRGDYGWEDDVVRITGEVFGDYMAGGVLTAIGGSLFDVPMR